MEPLWPHEPPHMDSTIDQPAPSITPFLVDSSGVRTAVLVFPGGGYTVKAAHEAEPIARRMNQAGFHSFVVDYRVSPYRHPVPLCDAARAVRTVRARAADWRVDPSRIGVIGFSAGGHLCATLSTRFTEETVGERRDEVDRRSARPDFAVLCYPVISFDAFGHTGSMANLLGHNPPWHLRRRLSCELQVSSATPPTFLWHTADDPVVPVENSLRYAEALRTCGVPVEIHVFESGRHGLGLAPEEPRIACWADLCVRWIDSL